MDITQSELPLTSFWDRIQNTRKKENQPPAGKRKRNVTGGGSSLKQRGKDKQPLQDATIPRSRVGGNDKPKSSNHIGEGKESAHEDTPSLLQGAAIVSDRHDGRPWKRRREALLSDSGVPTPPPTHVKKAQHRRDSSAPRPSSSLIHAAHHLPTPGTSVPRVARVRPLVGKPSSLVAPFSPLAARHILNSRGPSSPSSSSRNDDQPSSHSISVMTARSHANIVKAFLHADPRQHDRPAVDNRTAGKEPDDDPFSVTTAPAFVPSSQHFEDNLPLPPLNIPTSISFNDQENMVATPPISDITKTTALDSIITPRQSVVESSQSQHLLPHTSSPHRHMARYAGRETVESSQSQVLFPQAGSPRRDMSTYAPQDIVESSQTQAPLPNINSLLQRTQIARIWSGPSSAAVGQVVEGSQSQAERELTSSMGMSQLGLFTLSDVVASTEVLRINRKLNNHIDPIPNANNRISSPRTSSSHLSLMQWSSPLLLHSHQSSVSSRRKDCSILDSEIVTGSAGNLTIRPASRSPSQNKSSVNDDSATESENESVVANFIAEIKQKKRLSSPRVDNPPISIEPIVQDVLSEYKNSPSSEPIVFSSPPPVNYMSSPASTQNTQALYMAGAPPSDFTFPTMDLDESIPPFVKNFINMFDDDESSYPAYIPQELRD